MSTFRRVAETVGTAVLAGLFGGAVGSLVSIPVVGAGFAAANGAISGWRRTYDWSCSTGLVAFTLDSTWSLPMTSAGLVGNAVGLAQRDSGYVPELSTRQNRHVYRRGFMPRRGFATTLGNVIGGAGDVDRPRRRRLITDHEDVHIWQARWLGPFYPIVYVGWTVLAGAAGMITWLVRRRDQPFMRVVESVAYYSNPLEWWAYSRDDHWRPSAMVAGVGWQRPCCRPIALSRSRREPGSVQR
ncbi:hypothetical protein [Ilumatobacter sp.]|uniref:hypothetical protein n=1 Tax=Ilumatobacter sp. TaxID=1967498 RepID=UPI003C6886E5